MGAGLCRWRRRAAASIVGCRCTRLAGASAMLVGRKDCAGAAHYGGRRCRTSRAPWRVGEGSSRQLPSHQDATWTVGDPKAFWISDAASLEVCATRADPLKMRSQAPAKTSIVDGVVDPKSLRLHHFCESPAQSPIETARPTEQPSLPLTPCPGTQHHCTFIVLLHSTGCSNPYRYRPSRAPEYHHGCRSGDAGHAVRRPRHILLGAHHAEHPQ